MRKIYHILPIAIIGLSIASCQTSELDSNESTTFNDTMIFSACMNSDTPTKTERQEDGSVWWESNEKIKIFYDADVSGIFTSKNTTASKTANFEGQFNEHVTERDISNNGIYALYPAAEDASFNDGVITFSLPFQQEAKEGSFGKDMFPAIAKTKSTSLSFYNICGGVRFSVHNEGIISILFESNNGESIAGKIAATFDENELPEYSIIDGKSEIMVTAPGGGTFEVGKSYYIVSLPTTLENGFTITYNKEEESASININKKITIHRSKFGLVIDKDGNSFNVINFEDPTFKACVVDQYDDSFDGEIDYIEAENITSINCSNMEIRSLGGIEYFTNLKSLNCSNNSIKEINLGQLSKLTTLYCYNNPIESLILDGCTSLTLMSIINATSNSISDKKVTINGYESSTKFKFSAKGAGFTDFSFINSDTIETFEIDGDYPNSLNIYNIPGISELEVSHINTKVLDFHNLNLSSIDLTKNTDLTELYLYNNKLTSINLSKNTQLTKLNLSDNELQSINLRQNTLLTDLLLNNNSSISTLNIDNNLYLKTLEAEGLSISTIDMSQQNDLTDVKLLNNPNLNSMIIWDSATKRNDYLLFDMANVAVTDANGNSYGYPYQVGQYIPWFNGGVVFEVDTDQKHGKIVAQKEMSDYFYFNYENYSSEAQTRILSIFYANSTTDGELNHKAVYEYYGNYERFCAYEKCASYSRDNKYYLPAIEEMETLWTVAGKCNKELWGKSHRDYISIDFAGYLSSSITSGGYLLYIVSTGGDNPIMSRTSTYNHHFFEQFRAIRKF